MVGRGYGFVKRVQPSGSERAARFVRFRPDQASDCQSDTPTLSLSLTHAQSAPQCYPLQAQVSRADSAKWPAREDVQVVVVISRAEVVGP
jgi:hypothetical protein